MFRKQDRQDKLQEKKVLEPKISMAGSHFATDLFLDKIHFDQKKFYQGLYWSLHNKAHKLQYQPSLQAKRPRFVLPCWILEK